MADDEIEIQLDTDGAREWVTLSASEAGATHPDGGRSQPGSIGRTEVLQRLGGGAMGIVYLANDPELSRKVALKVLGGAPNPHSEDQWRGERLRREAQALAQLSHENVVNVYDVGMVRLAGGEERVYIAMQFVEGIDLAEWLRQRKAVRRTRRLLRETLDVFAKAGRGLAAAHEAGLVHRDFKPANVLIGSDGSVRVADFGLARAATRGTELDEPRVLEEQPTNIDDTPAPLLDTMTVPGVVAGTPPYMAPEQFLGEDVDSRTDQFAFCVALYEALYGERPFEGRTFASLRRNVTRGRTRPPPKDVRVPKRLRRIALRGLRVDPEARHPDMMTLVDRLSRDRRANRLRIALPAAALAGAVAAIGIVGLTGAGHEDKRCKLASSHLVGVWDAETKQAVRAAFRATDQAHADEVFDRVDERLDAHFDTWITSYADTCEATHVRGEQSAEALDLRMRCLDRRLGEARAVIDLFASGTDVRVLDRALGAVANLSGPEQCADVDALRAVVALPTDPQVIAEVDAVGEVLDEVNALQQAGRFERGLELASSAADRARALEYPPLLARALFLQASLEDKSADFAASETTYYDAARAAGSAHDDRLAAAILTGLVTLVGDRLRRLDDAMTLSALAEAAVARAGNEPSLRAELLNSQGKLLIAKGQYREAQTHFERSLAMRRDMLGKRHPDVARTLNNLAVAVYHQGELVAAEAYYRDAIAIAEDVLGARHPHLAAFLSNLGSALSPQGRYDEAQSLHRRALEIRERALGPNHPHVANSLGNLGNLARDRGDYECALAYYQRALDIDRDALGPAHPEIAQSLTDIGFVYRALGKRDEAHDHFRRAIEILDDALGPDHPSLGRPLTGTSQVYLEQGRPALALDAATRAVRVLEAHSGDPLELAEARFALARAAWESNTERPRALELAHLARDVYATVPDMNQDVRDEVDAWLARRERQ